MKFRFYKKIIAALTIIATSITAQAQYITIEEDPIYIRFEQYTGAGGNLAFWRLPSPGASNFPNSSCKAIGIPSDRSEHASRFMALYLYAKTNNKQVFYLFDPTSCMILSFGMNG